jgi:outer membrane protein OmpA-like peptidoglycan-associated protein
VEPPQVEQGAATRLRAKAEATDTRKHPLAYVWSSNGGEIVAIPGGSGAEVELDASRLNPGVYSVAVAAQDAYKHQADCIAHFQVIVPTDPLTAKCTAEPQEVEQGKEVRFRVDAADRLGHALRYRWFANGGRIEGRGAEAVLQTAGLEPREYTVTSRVEDDWGHASDCMAMVRVTLPAPPPIPPEMANIAQIVFGRNVSRVGEPERQQLEKVLERLRKDAEGRVSLESYAGPDENGPEALAAARAEAVRQHLVQNGVSESRIETVVGLGGRLGGVRNRTLDVIWIPDGMEY